MNRLKSWYLYHKYMNDGNILNHVYVGRFIFFILGILIVVTPLYFTAVETGELYYFGDEDENYYNITINYQNFSEEEIVHVDKLMEDMRNYYLVKTNEITFTKDKNEVSIFCSRLDLKLIGCHNGFGKIKIHYSSNYSDSSIKTLICHEVLHTLIKTSKDKEEILIDSILEQEIICFK